MRRRCGRMEVGRGGRLPSASLDSVNQYPRSSAIDANTVVLMEFCFVYPGVWNIR